MFDNNDREINVLCQIQEILNQIGFSNKINLPTIIVIGSQSSGKSSVLEHIAGKDFLPRGQGIVTRRPVIIQRLVDPKAKSDYAVIDGNNRVNDFTQLSAYLHQKMKEAAQTELGVTADPVVVKIVSATGVNISMIDMPGLTKIALQGQNPDFPKIIEDINRTYIQNPNSILLAVSPANVDVANSDSLRLTKEYDPTGERTIGVFTKMDLLEDPHTISKAFEGRAYPLKLGYFGIVCRNQKEIDSRMTIAQALAKEQKHFQGNALFAKYQQFCGIGNLIYHLNRCLLVKIKDTLPYVKSTLKNLMREKEESYTNFKKINDLYKTKNYSALLYNIVHNFSTNFTNALKGGTANLKVTDKIFGGAKINLIFEKEFNKKLYETNLFEKIKDEEIYWTIKNTSGLQQNVFFSNETFESLAKRQIIELRQACLDCLMMVNEEIKNIARDIVYSMKELEVFIQAQKEILNNLQDIMISFYNQAKNAIELRIKIESGHINQKNPQFMPIRNGVLEGKIKYINEDKGAFMGVFKRGSNANAFANDKDVTIMKNLLIGYNLTVKDSLYDYVPKCVISLFINELLEVADTELSTRLLKNGNETRLCAIDNEKITQIMNSEQEIENLRRALSILESIN